MKLKLTNILAILLTIIIVGGILYPWSKNNVENFVTGTSESIENRIQTVYQNLLKTKLYANDLENRVNTLNEQIDKKGTVSKDDYIKLINDVQTELQSKINDNESLGYKIHTELQKDKINELNNSISLLSNKITNLGFDISSTDPTNSPLQNSNIASIRSIHNGINLNVKNLSMNNLDENTYNSISKNLSSNYPTIMIFLNNGCLKYNNEDGKYSSNNCELTNTNQYFVFKIINNGDELLEHLDGVYLEQQKNINQNNNTSQYPFNIIYPISNIKKCLKIDIDGISIEDCRPLSLNLDQRWVSSPKINQICS